MGYIYIFKPNGKGGWVSNDFGGTYKTKRLVLEGIALHHLKLDISELNYISDSILERMLDDVGVTVIFTEVVL
mgnify:CR=1 FL=1